MKAEVQSLAPWLHIFILCHNRPEDAEKAIASVLAQSDANFTLTVSDNSSTDDVLAMVRRMFPTVRYLRRLPMLSAMEHFNLCIDESTADYFCLFHDDDVMHPTFVQVMRQAAKTYPKAVALGCNATVEVMGRVQEKPSFLARHAQQVIDSANTLAARYFARSQSGIAPFPGYIYQRHQVGAQRFLTDGGKYADVTWLLELSRHASIVWMTQPLMTYRMHSGNDGNTESRRDRLRFLAYLKRQRQWLSESIIHDYRCSFVYKPLVQDSVQPRRARRTQVARTFLSAYRWARYGRWATYVALWERALVKHAKRS